MTNRKHRGDREPDAPLWLLAVGMTCLLGALVLLLLIPANRWGF